jgi:hypothetical protein
VGGGLTRADGAQRAQRQVGGSRLCEESDVACRVRGPALKFSKACANAADGLQAGVHIAAEEVAACLVCQCLRLRALAVATSQLHGCDSDERHADEEDALRQSAPRWNEHAVSSTWTTIHFWLCYLQRKWPHGKKIICFTLNSDCFLHLAKPLFTHPSSVGLPHSTTYLKRRFLLDSPCHAYPSASAPHDRNSTLTSPGSIFLAYKPTQM